MVWSSAGLLNHLSTKSINTPPKINIMETTQTFSKTESIKSPAKKPIIAAGRKATKSFQ